ncbi:MULTISPECIES: hypothetical protein [Streptomyces]|uniref:hypothetical protein n=1 Tax=Streptomyces TaxID=1883 RepID=UPI00278C3286|nr:hypothetical protein [Streptomyces hydrogenans]
MIAGIGVAILGILGVVWGARFAFNLRGAADRAVARRNDVRAGTGARIGDLTMTAPSTIGPRVFRLCGALVLLLSPLLVLVGLVVATRG